MILSNQVRCHACGDTPFSTHHHDFEPCKCGAISVDGGLSYLRRVGDIHAYDDLSITWPEEACQKAINLANSLLVSPEIKATSLAGAMIVRLGMDGIHYEGNGTTQAVVEACQWSIDNGRNGLGVLCAVARYVRDAGGQWMVNEHG